MKTNNKELTIVITTYNRKEPLLEQLRSIEKQGLYDYYDVIVSDNHSNYNVKEWLELSLSSEFLQILNVVQRPFNIGGSMNITLSFTLAKTKWMWLLSDDDMTEPGSIEGILEDIKKHESDDVCWIKYSISGSFQPNVEYSCDNLKDLFGYYSTIKKGAGEFIFMSNNVFRLDYLRPYISDVCVFSDTCMSQCILPMFAIKKDNKKVFFSSRIITNYTPGNGSWMPVWAYLRFGNVLSITSLSFDRPEIRAFKRVPFWNEKLLLLSLLCVKDQALRFEYLKRIVISHSNIFSWKATKILLLYLAVLIIGTERVKHLVEKRNHNRT